jgi:hypothetical protein
MVAIREQILPWAGCPYSTKMILLTFAALIVTICSSSSSTENDWYHPEPLLNRDENPPLVLPATTSRPVFPLLTQVGEQVAMSKLENYAIIALTSDEWRELKIASSPSVLLDQLTNQKEKDGGNRDWDLYIPGIGNGTVHYNSPMPGSEEAVANWRKLKPQFRPYLLRAVAVDGKNSKFFASLWRNRLTIIHQSTIIGDTKGDLHRRQVALIDNPRDVELMKTAVIVYLEAKPTEVYTNIEVLKLGR